MQTPMLLPRRPRAVVFDMDGLIFDTEALYRTALFEVAADAGHPMTEAIFLAMIGSPWPANRAFLLQQYGADYPADAIREASHERLRERTVAAPFLKSGVIELLDALAGWGLPHAIATSSQHEAVQENLAGHGLAHRFPHVIAHGDYANGKPAPDPFLLAAHRLGVDPADCVALEDSHQGVRSAAAAGMMTIMVPDLLDSTAEMEQLCALIVPDLHAVRRILAETLPQGLRS